MHRGDVSLATRPIRWTALACSAACLLSPVAGLAETAPPPPDLTLLPEERVLFDWQTERCERWDIPDTPLRAWRGEDGAVRLVAGSEATRASVGSSPMQVSRDCRTLLEGAQDPDPAARNDRWWIASTFVLEDGRVIALVHAEYHGHSHDGACASDVYLTCWRNAILAAESTDGGATFDVDTEVPVAALPYAYDRRQTGRTGYFSPSNIIEVDGYLYAFVFASPYRDQQRGVCLMRRSADRSDPTWRAWDGTDFAVQLSGRRDAPTALCQPLEGVRGNLTSVTRHGDGFLAVSPMTAPDRDGATKSGFWALASTDLITWSAPVLVLERPLLWRSDCHAPYTYAYPAFLDPGSTDRNFATVSRTFWLTFVQMRLAPNCRAGPDRDLVARSVRLNHRTGADAPRMTSP